MAFSFSRPRPRDIIGWCLLAAALTFAVYVRLRLRDFPLERDEGEFAYAGQLLLHGIPPYKLAYNMKLPGTYMAYAVLMAVFGQTIAGVHLGLLAINAATIWLLYRLTRELFDPISAGLAAIFYATASVNPGVLGFAAHATHFVAFFGVAGVYLLWRYLQSGRWASLPASGFLLGTAFLMKQQGVFLMVFGGAVMAVYAVAGFVMALRGRRFGERSWLVLTAQAAAFCAAAVLPYLLVCFWLWRAGVYDTFWFWTVTYAREYVGEVPLAGAWNQFWYGEGAHVIASDWLTWLLAAAGLLSILVRAAKRPGRSSFVVGFLVCSILCVCPGFWFRSHYFVVALPAVAMLAGLACGDFLCLSCLWKLRLAAPSAVHKEAPGRRKRSLAKAEADSPTPATFTPLAVLAGLMVMAAVVWPLFAAEKSFILFEWPPELACRITYTGNPFVEAPAIAEYLNKNMKEDDTLAVLGSEPEIPFYSHRHSSTGYIYTYGLMEQQPLAETMQRKMIEEIERTKPKYILVVDAYCSWLYHSKSCFLLFDWANRYLRENYDAVGLIERPARLPHAPLRPINFRWSETGNSETPVVRPLRNARGEVSLGWLGKLDGYQANPLDAECTVWVCRRK